jgi:phenylacetic acid degradation operon negative regulatory protein
MSMLHFTSNVSNCRNNETIEEYTERLGMRRFTARSLVLSVLLGSDPPRLPVGALIDFCSLFDIAPGTVRTALSRMVASREIDSDDGAYVLTGDLLQRRRQQDVGRVAAPDEWDGSWWTAVALADARDITERRRFRSAMEGAKMGELRPTAWMRPSNIGSPPPLRDLIISRGDLPPAVSRSLVDRLWRLEALDRRAGELLTILRPDSDDLAKRFIALATCLRYLRTEPQLPRSLAGDRRADELRDAYTPEEVRFQGDLRMFLRVSTGAR